MEPQFSVERARRTLERLRPTIDELIAVRADTAELAVTVGQGGESPLGGMAEFKAAEARFGELLSSIATGGVQVKSVAPLLLDFPARLGQESVLLCWLEGDTELGWYHRLDTGFAGRRPLPADA